MPSKVYNICQLAKVIVYIVETNSLFILVVCDPPCQNDAPCVANDTCNCITGYTGSVCESKLLIVLYGNSISSSCVYM